MIGNGKLGRHRGSCFSVQLGSKDGDVFRYELGSEERKIEETACFLSKSGCPELAKGKKGRKGEKEGRKVGSTSNP